MTADHCLFPPFQISSLKELTGAYDGSSDSFLPVSERLRGQKGSRGEPGERGPPGREVSTVGLQGVTSWLRLIATFPLPTWL